ncbi:MAG: 4-hydroxythreonine-4-phosphate dehydrogenase PdxA [Ignavibacteriales bacterium]|nr:4-hydroxythreonine-4-phosphate dehydrogenase PdxA [Ignavibacteriales bacterium]
MKTLAFTCGDINGIGPEICIKAINHFHNPTERKIILFCPANVFENALSISPVSFNYQIVKDYSQRKNESELVTIVDIGRFKQNIGGPTKNSGDAALIALKSAFDLVNSKSADAIITAPVSKTSFKLAKIKYPGQTELFADLSHSKKYLMTFLSDQFICGLATIHEPIRKVSKLLSAQLVKSTLKTLLQTMIYDLGIQNPKIAVLGLNPHSGENGKIGREEIDIIKPAIKSFKNNLIEGPFVPDAFFANQLYKVYDAVLGMYHDQVLIPFKMMNFNNGVNFTAGLPIIRTSPDHGTAYDIAGKGIADPSSMIEAGKWSERIISNRRKL